MAERWLVIDDSSTIQRVIKLAFQGYDVHITEADSIAEATREMTASLPTLVIADAALGGVQGVQDFLALKAQAPAAPFIILEGSYDNIDETQFRTAGFRHFLKKPFDGSQLLSITRQALGRALPYRGEAAVAAAAGAPQPPSAMPPPPPPLRKTMAEGHFPPESTQTGGFDLGLHDHRASASTLVSTSDPRFAPTPINSDPRGLAPTQVIPVDPRGLAQTQVIPVDPRGMVHDPRDGRAAAGDPRSMAHDPRAASGDPRGMAHDPRQNQFSENRSTAADPRSMAQTEVRGPFSDNRSPSGDPRAMAHDPRSVAQTEVRGPFSDNRGTSGDPRAMAPTQIIPPDNRGSFSDNRGTSAGSDSGEFRGLPDSHSTDSRARGDTRSLIAAEARAMASAHLNTMAPSAAVRNPVSFSLEDDEPASHPTATSWDGPRPAGSHLGNLLEPMLQEEMEKIVRASVEDYCRKHFAGIARELIQRELDRLTQDRSRLLMD